MKKGDLVMFVDEGIYAKWFYGQMGEVVNYTIRDRDGAAYCRVKWLRPVAYFDSFTGESSFAADKFRVLSGNR